MDTNNQPVTPTTPTQNKNIGPIISTLVIVLILIIAALYVFASKINQTPLPTDETASSPALSPATTTRVSTISNKADDIDSLQKDLDTSTDGLNGQGF